MTQNQWNELYNKLYEVYVISSIEDAYIRSTIGDALDHMIALKEQNLITSD